MYKEFLPDICILGNRACLVYILEISSNGDLKDRLLKSDQEIGLVQAILVGVVCSWCHILDQAAALCLKWITFSEIQKPWSHSTCSSLV